MVRERAIYRVGIDGRFAESTLVMLNVMQYRLNLVFRIVDCRIKFDNDGALVDSN